MNGFEKRLTVRVAYGVLVRTLCRCRLEGTTFKLHPNSLFEGAPGSGLETVGVEFQPSFETVHPGGGAHLFFVVNSIFVFKSMSFRGSAGPEPPRIESSQHFQLVPDRRRCLFQPIGCLQRPIGVLTHLSQCHAGMKRCQQHFTS